MSADTTTRTGRTTEVLNARVPADVHAWLKSIADAHGISMAAVTDALLTHARDNLTVTTRIEVRPNH